MTAGLFEGATFYFILTIPPSYPFHGEACIGAIYCSVGRVCLEIGGPLPTWLPSDDNV